MFFIPRVVGNFFMVVGGGGGSGEAEWSTMKNKKKHWLKRPRAVSKKRNLNKNINYSKSHICNSFFENSISGIQSFYTCPDVLLDII